MLKLGSLALGGEAPRVAVGFSDQIIHMDIDNAKKAGLDIAEIRIDQFRSFNAKDVVKKLALFKNIPTIATIRLKEEGGSWKGSETLRQELFEAVVPHVDAIDIELSSKNTIEKIGPLVKKRGKLLIVSYHDMKTTPDLPALQKIVKNAEAAGADIVKIATRIHKNQSKHMESLTALLVQHARKNLIVIGMGSEGVITRLLFPRLGSLVTFAFAGDVRTPGQLPYEEMHRMLRQLYPAYNEEKLVKLKLLEYA